MNRIEQIKLIADFMDSDYQEIENLCRIDLYEKGFRTEEILGNPERWTCYHNDFSCLMEVVENIERLEEVDYFRIEIAQVRIVASKNEDDFYHCTEYSNNGRFLDTEGGFITKIEAVYNAVINFIKWYNENK